MWRRKSITPTSFKQQQPTTTNNEDHRNPHHTRRWPTTHLPTCGQFDMTWSYEQCQDHGDCHIRWFYLRAKPKSTSLRVKPFLGKRSTSTASSPLSCWWCSKHLPVFTENVLRLDVEVDDVPCVQILNSWMVTVVKPPPLAALTFGKKKQHKDEKILKPDKICPTKPATSLSVRSCSSGFRY